MYDDLYQELIVDHGRHPRNHRVMTDPTVQAEGVNPLCGDEVELFVKIAGQRIVELSFVGAGCAISQASASLLTEAVAGKTVAEAKAMVTALQAVMTSDVAADQELGSLAALVPVREYPMRVKCVTLAWHTLNDALRRIS
jgi:nitrogen fixation NifU-like protein